MCAEQRVEQADTAALECVDNLAKKDSPTPNLEKYLEAFRDPDAAWETDRNANGRRVLPMSVPDVSDNKYARMEKIYRELIDARKALNHLRSMVSPLIQA